MMIRIEQVGFRSTSIGRLQSVTSGFYQKFACGLFFQRCILCYTLFFVYSASVALCTCIPSEERINFSL